MQKPASPSGIFLPLLGLWVILPLRAATPPAGPSSAAAAAGAAGQTSGVNAGRVCYRQTGVITCADDRTRGYCQISQPLDFLREADGSVRIMYRGGSREDSCGANVHPARGTFSMSCPVGSGSWNWQPPPSLWCEDEPKSLSASAVYSGHGHIEGHYWTNSNEAFQSPPRDTSRSGGTVSGRDPFGWFGVDARGSRGEESGSASDLRPRREKDTFLSIGVVIRGWGQKAGGNATDNIGFGVEYLYERFVTGAAATPAPPSPSGGALCYQRVSIVTCADDRSKGYCQISQPLDFTRNSDGTITIKYRGGSPRDSCGAVVDPGAGVFRIDCPSGSGSWNWRPPPVEWCVDATESLEASALFSGSGKVEGHYWTSSNEAFQSRPRDSSRSGGTVSGRDPFDWLGVEVRGSRGESGGRVDGLRPRPEKDAFRSIGIVIRGWGNKEGGNATDNVGFGVEYVYEGPLKR